MGGSWQEAKTSGLVYTLYGGGHQFFSEQIFFSFSEKVHEKKEILWFFSETTFSSYGKGFVSSPVQGTIE